MSKTVYHPLYWHYFPLFEKFDSRSNWIIFWWNSFALIIPAFIGWKIRIAFKVFDCMVLRPSYFFCFPLYCPFDQKLDRSVVEIMYLMESFKELGSFKEMTSKCNSYIELPSSETCLLGHWFEITIPESQSRTE